MSTLTARQKERLSKQCEEEMLSFVDKHAWNTGQRTSAIYTSYHLIPFFIDSLDRHIKTERGNDE